jgi:hypothetical protein
VKTFQENQANDQNLINANLQTSIDELKAQLEAKSK